MQPIDAARCPLCGGENRCGLAAGRRTCWCFYAAIADDVLERVPVPLRGEQCVCPRCAGAEGPSDPEAL